MSAPPVTVSDWIPAGFAPGDATVFAVGDVHGCAAELGALLDAIAATATPPSRQRRLVFLGDLIDRGPDSCGALALWAGDAAARGVDRVDRLMGNHEQLLRLMLAGSPHAAKAEGLWLRPSMGGGSFLAELRARAGRPDARLDADLMRAALGQPVLDAFLAMGSHLTLGNTVFVHAGLDPSVDAETCLARPWTDFAEARWAWIQEGFLGWRGGFGGRLVVHGHTPPHKHRVMADQDDPHELRHDRLGLDGGTTRTGLVTAAQIETGRYRILRAGVTVDDLGAHDDPG